MVSALIRGLAMGGLYGLLAITIALVRRATGALSFAHGEIGGVAALVAWSLIAEYGSPWPLAVAGSIAITSVVVAVFERFVARRVAGDDASSTTATVALLFFLLAVGQRRWGVYPKVIELPLSARGTNIAGAFVSPAQVIALISAGALAVALTLSLRRTTIGLSTLAVAHDRTEAALLGVRVAAIERTVWVGSAVLAVVSALLFAPVVGAIGPGTMTFFFLRALTAVAVGGTNTIVAPFVAALGVGVVEQVAVQAFIRSEVPGVDLMAVVAILVVGIAFRHRSTTGAFL